MANGCEVVALSRVVLPTLVDAGPSSSSIGSPLIEPLQRALALFLSGSLMRSQTLVSIVQFCDLTGLCGEMMNVVDLIVFCRKDEVFKCGLPAVEAEVTL